VSLVDLYPTLIELCGLERRSDLAGRSLLPLLLDPAAARAQPVLTMDGESFALRSEDWRYIRYQDGGEELYDHRTDPEEWTNVADAAEHAALKKELAALLPAEVAPPLASKPAQRAR
jgi:arylsulfatase A-like enzyme